MTKQIHINVMISEVYLELSQTPIVGFFTKIING